MWFPFLPLPIPFFRFKSLYQRRLAVDADPPPRLLSATLVICWPPLPVHLLASFLPGPCFLSFSS